MKKYILVLDQGTTSSRSIIFDKKGSIIGVSQKEIKQYFPQPGWVEHDPMEILATQIHTLKEVVTKAKIDPQDIAGIGITNQRETTVLWDRDTGKPVHPAIVWQCRRSHDICEQLRRHGYEEMFKEKTGLVLDAYFSGTKLKWLFDTYPDLLPRAKRGELLFGTIDSWLLFNLTNGTVHTTDVSNASRTLLFNIHKLEWDTELLEIVGVPREILPKVKSSSEIYGQLDKRYLGLEIPIAGIAGDQQAALFGQTCFDKGDVKNTYGTGCFMLMNTGTSPVSSRSGLLTSIGWEIGGKVTYVLEGSIFIAGAVIQWLRDELQIVNTAAETGIIAKNVDDNGGVYFVPAFVGLGTPYWDMDARGIISGLTRGTGKDHIIRAALESIAYQTKDVLDCMKKDSGISIKLLRVDGGASANDFLMQFQADLLGVSIQRPKQVETTALGAAYLTGLATGLWKDKDQLIQSHDLTSFTPTTERKEIEKYYKGWQRAVKAVLKKVD
ncbi:MAG: Glycerol kinase [Microgenomates bacterium OLB22]|nr:MAG: Glycerol kinase [Microgenomates bacterium OLB22]